MPGRGRALSPLDFTQKKFQALFVTINKTSLCESLLLQLSVPLDARFSDLKAYLEGVPLSEQSLTLVLPFGIGDLLLVLSLLSEFIRRGPADLRVTLVVKTSQSPLLDFFASPQILGVSVDSIDPSLALDLGRFDRFERGRLICPHLLSFQQGRLFQELNHRHPLVRDLYLEMFGLSIQTPLQAPVAPAGLEAKAQAFLKEHGLDPKRDVLLAPAATSIRPLPSLFWQQQVQALQQAGKRLWTNISSEGERPIEGSRALIIPLDLLFFAPLFFGQVIALRSGLCDWLACTQVPLRVFYPQGPQYPPNLLTSNTLAWRGRPALEEKCVDVGVT